MSWTGAARCAARAGPAIACTHRARRRARGLHRQPRGAARHARVGPHSAVGRPAGTRTAHPHYAPSHASPSPSLHPHASPSLHPHASPSLHTRASPSLATPFHPLTPRPPAPLNPSQPCPPFAGRRASRLATRVASPHRQHGWRTLHGMGCRPCSRSCGASCGGIPRRGSPNPNPNPNPKTPKPQNPKTPKALFFIIIKWKKIIPL